MLKNNLETLINMEVLIKIVNKRMNIVEMNTVVMKNLQRKKVARKRVKIVLKKERRKVDLIELELWLLLLRKAKS